MLLQVPISFTSNVVIHRQNIIEYFFDHQIWFYIIRKDKEFFSFNETYGLLTSFPAFNNQLKDVDLIRNRIVATNCNAIAALPATFNRCN